MSNCKGRNGLKNSGKRDRIPLPHKVGVGVG